MSAHTIRAAKSYAEVGLSNDQAGHVRRILNLASQLPDDWSGMMGRSSLQEDFGAFRFQLAYMAYALALTHVHRLPAAPAYFRKPFQQLIAKILSPDVWTYWHYVSTGNGPYNQALGELPAQWNPVETDNIMYSAYVQSMALLYHVLFDDPKYAAPGALTFNLRPLFWGGGDKRFAYDEKSLNEHLYWTMAAKGYLGIACEPNCVFQICNQIPILGFRFHDLVYGGNRAGEVTAGYLQAWSEFGIASDKGHFHILVKEREHELVSRAPIAWGDFWLGSLMHAWNPAFVETHYPKQIAAWIQRGPDDTLWIKPSIPPAGFLREVTTAQDFGWAAVCASELGDQSTLTGLLAYADRFLNRVEDSSGALYYARRDGWFDDAGRLAAMDPHTGNALLSYARLNVPNGLQQLYAGAWREDHFKQPALVAMPDGLDVRTARFYPSERSLRLEFYAAGLSRPTTSLDIANIWNRGQWSISLDGESIGFGDSRQITRTTGMSMERVGEVLRLNYPIDRGRTCFEMEWH